MDVLINEFAKQMDLDQRQVDVLVQKFATKEEERQLKVNRLCHSMANCNLEKLTNALNEQFCTRYDRFYITYANEVRGKWQLQATMYISGLPSEEIDCTLSEFGLGVGKVDMYNTITGQRRSYTTDLFHEGGGLNMFMQSIQDNMNKRGQLEPMITLTSSGPVHILRTEQSKRTYTGKEVYTYMIEFENPGTRLFERIHSNKI